MERISWYIELLIRADESLALTIDNGCKVVRQMIQAKPE
jgi:hypothetical protein